MRQQTIIKAIALVTVLIILISCRVNQKNYSQRQLTFKDSFRVSVFNNGDTISPECLNELEDFKKGLTYSGEFGKFYGHKDKFDIALNEVLPCLKNIKIASWYLLFPEMKYVVPWSNTQEPYYYIKTANNSGTTGFIIQFTDSFFVNGGPTIIRENSSDPIGH